MINLDFKGWNSQAHREFPGKFESSNVSRDNVSREIGRTGRTTLRVISEAQEVRAQQTGAESKVKPPKGLSPIFTSLFVSVCCYWFESVFTVFPRFIFSPTDLLPHVCWALI